MAGCGRSTRGVDQIFFPPLMWGKSHTRLCNNSRVIIKAWGKIIVVVVIFPRTVLGKIGADLEIWAYLEQISRSGLILSNTGT